MNKRASPLCLTNGVPPSHFDSLMPFERPTICQCCRAPRCFLIGPFSTHSMTINQHFFYGVVCDEAYDGMVHVLESFSILKEVFLADNSVWVGRSRYGFAFFPTPLRIIHRYPSDSSLHLYLSGLP